MPSPFFEPILVDMVLATDDGEALVVDAPTREQIESADFPLGSRFPRSDAGRKAATRYMGPARFGIREARIEDGTRPRLLDVEDAARSVLPETRRVFVALSEGELHTTGRLDAALPQTSVHSLKNHLHPALTAGGDLDERIGRLEAPVSPAGTLYILAIMRTGSYLLAELATGLGLGRPAEHLRDPIVKALRACDRDDLSFETWWSSLEASHREPNGWFGTKLITHYVERLNRVLDSAEAAWLDSRISAGHVVTLTRDDRVSQAVSAYRAMETGVYRATNDQHLDRERRAEVPYDLDRLVERYQFLGEQAALLESWADSLTARSERLDLTYEGIVADLPATVQRLAAHAGVRATPIADKPPQNRELSSRAKAEMVERFRADLAQARDPQSEQAD